MLTELETLAEDHDNEAVQKHIDQAYENVVFTRRSRDRYSLTPFETRSNEPGRGATMFGSNSRRRITELSGLTKPISWLRDFYLIR